MQNFFLITNLLTATKAATIAAPLHRLLYFESFTPHPMTVRFLEVIDSSTGSQVSTLCSNPVCAIPRIISNGFCQDCCAVILPNVSVLIFFNGAGYSILKTTSLSGIPYQFFSLCYGALPPHLVGDHIYALDFSPRFLLLGQEPAASL